jgi:photosystem II stability/assembly factor-like uncharacterized protein
VYKSTDGGSNWSIVGLAGVHVNALVIDPATPSTVYAAADWAGVLKSTDGGATWQQTAPGPFMTQSLAIDPLNPTTIYAADTFVGDEGFTWPGGVFKSIDGGDTWTVTGLAAGIFGGLAIDPQTPTTIYVGGIWLIDYQTSAKGIFKSTDGGSTWTTTDCNSFCNLAVDPRTPTTLYLGTSSGVDKSTDGGATWASANTGLTDTLAAYGAGSNVGQPVVAPVAPSTPPDDQPAVYVNTSIGVFKTTDGGASWSPTGLFQQSPLSSVSLDPSTVPGGTSSRGTLILATVAPAGGMTIALSSSDPSAASVPANVTVPAGAMSATFAVSTSPVTVYAWVEIFASSADATRSALLLVIPTTTLSGISVVPVSVPGGIPRLAP